MALNNNKEQYLKKAKQLMFYGFVLFLLIFNVFVFCRYISSNPEYTINYQTPTDEMKEFRNPLIGVSFYDNTGNVKILLLPDNIVTHPYSKIPEFLKNGKRQIGVLENEKTTETHIEYLKENAINIKKINFNEIKDDLLLVWFDNLENPLSDFEKIINYAKANKLHPKAMDLLDFAQINYTKNKKTIFTLNEQYENLKMFANDYGQKLKDYIRNYAEQSINQGHLHDKASIIVLVCANGDECEEFGDFDFNESVLKSISKNMIKADKKYPNVDKRVFLVTKLEKQNFNLEDDFINSLNPSLGVVMKKGLLTGVMLPIFWEKYAEKKDFVNKLKIKSGINPDYWSNDIQIYYFKAVEI